SSSLWKRVFSRHRMSPSFSAATAVAAGSPMQSSAKATGFLTTFDSSSATGLSDSLGSRPFGRPKCASRMTLPPLSEISVMVGATRSSRVASLTRPFSMGTLRSTRSSTRLPFTSTSSRVRNVLVIFGSLVPGALRREVPSRRTETYGVAWAPALRSSAGALHRLVDLLWIGGALGDDLEVNDRDVRGRHADRNAVELALQLRQHEADRLGGAGRGRDHRHRRGAAAIEILVHGVERRLVAGIGVDRGHEAGLDADEGVQHLGHRREAVGGAGPVRDH